MRLTMDIEALGTPSMDAASKANRDQLHLASTVLGLPVTYHPFKFESRRSRIDWRLLHGVDIDKLIHNTDLDTLEQLVSCITWGDIEAEDTRHLSEGNFVKVFRLAQLLLEYLLYVQDNLNYTNSVLERSRTAMVLNAQSLSSRCHVLRGQLKSCKRELRRARKTAKTFEIMATAVGAGAAAAAATAVPGVAAAQPAAQQQQQQQQQPVQQPVPAIVSGHQQTVPSMSSILQQQQEGSHLVCMSEGEWLLQHQLTELSERLAIVGAEAARLREEREELQYTVRHLYDTLAAKTGVVRLSLRHFSPRHSGVRGRGSLSPSHLHTGASAAGVAAGDTADSLPEGAVSAQQHQLLVGQLAQLEDQLAQVRHENVALRQQLSDHQSAGADAATDALLKSVRAQLEDRTKELQQLQGELCQRDASIAVFQQANDSLQQQLQRLQKQLASPEATTPSFVASQRNKLTAAETKAQQAEVRASQLVIDNTNLASELQELRGQLRRASEAASLEPVPPPAAAAASGRNAPKLEADAVAAAERLLAGDSQTSKASGGASTPQQQQQQEVAQDWKLREIERLQEENRLLQDKVVSLQEQLHELEHENTLLGRQAAKARSAGLTSSLDSLGQHTAGGSAGSVKGSGSWLQQGGAAGWASVDSSGPRQELTAADLAHGSVTADRTDTLDASREDVVGQPRTISRPAAAAANYAAAVGDGAASGGDAGLFRQTTEQGVFDRTGSGQKAGLGVRDGALNDEEQEGVDGGGVIAAFRPDSQEEQQQQQLPAMQSHRFHAIGKRSDGSAGGTISHEATQELKQLMAQMAASPEQFAEHYSEACDDWDKPFDLNAQEKEVFRSYLPFTMKEVRGLLMAVPHNQQELAANRPRLLAAINRQLDAELASYGIHPGRTGLSDQEFVAAMKMLGGRREAWARSLSRELQEQVEVVRLGLMLHPYNTVQQLLATQPADPDGKKRLPGPTEPSLVSAVRLPQSAAPTPRAAAAAVGHQGNLLQPGPPPIRTGAPAAAGAAVMGERDSGGGRNTPRSQHSAPFITTNTRYQGSEVDSNDGSHPYYQQQQGTAARHSPMSSSARNLTAPQAAAAGATDRGGGTVSPVVSRTASYTITTVRASGGLPAAEGNGAGFSPMSAALHAKQQSGVASPREIPASPTVNTARAQTPASQKPEAAAGGLTAAAGGSDTAANPAAIAAAAAGLQQLTAPNTSQGPLSAQYGAGGRVVDMGSVSSRSKSPLGPLAGAQQQARAAPAGAAVAAKQYFDSSFDDSEEC